MQLHSYSQNKTEAFLARNSENILGDFHSFYSSRKTHHFAVKFNLFVKISVLDAGRRIEETVKLQTAFEPRWSSKIILEYFAL